MFIKLSINRVLYFNEFILLEFIVTELKSQVFTITEVESEIVLKKLVKHELYYFFNLERIFL